MTVTDKREVEVTNRTPERSQPVYCERRGCYRNRRGIPIGYHLLRLGVASWMCPDCKSVVSIRVAADA